MFSIPSNLKYQKNNKGRIRGLKIRHKNKLIDGTYALVSNEFGYLTAKQLEASRRVVAKVLRKGTGRLWYRVTLNKQLTKKPSEVRMGKGKGNHFLWVYPIKPGKILLELVGLPGRGKKLLKVASTKLPVRLVLLEQPSSWVNYIGQALTKYRI